MEWNCTLTEDRLSDYLDGTLTLEEATRIINATSGPRKESKGFKNVLAWRPLVLRPRFVMSLVTVAATILILLYTTGMTPQHLKHADLSPSTMVRSANRQAHLTFAKSVKFVNDLRVVYEIQTRLQPEQEPSPSRPTSEENTPSGKPQEKSQTTPHPGHSQARSTALFAMAVGIGAPQGFLGIGLGMQVKRSKR
jgi:hypothetical protein